MCEWMDDHEHLSCKAECVEIGVYTGVLVIRVLWAAPACSPTSAPTMHVTPTWSDIALSRLELHVPRT
jgi:hypothetical protein